MLRQAQHDGAFTLSLSKGEEAISAAQRSVFEGRIEESFLRGRHAVLTRTIYRKA